MEWPTFFSLLNGRTSPSFFMRTTDSEAKRLSKAAVSGVSRPFSSAFSGMPEAAHSFTRFKTSRARSSSDVGPSLLHEAACSAACPLNRVGPGISRSRPALMDSETEYVPNLLTVSLLRYSTANVSSYQSLMTNPFQPHSVRRMSWRIFGFSLTCVPLILL